MNNVAYIMNKPANIDLVSKCGNFHVTVPYDELSGTWRFPTCKTEKKGRGTANESIAMRYAHKMIVFLEKYGRKPL